jgi:hypothetical protein
VDDHVQERLALIPEGFRKLQTQTLRVHAECEWTQHRLMRLRAEITADLEGNLANRRRLRGSTARSAPIDGSVHATGVRPMMIGE